MRTLGGWVAPNALLLIAFALLALADFFGAFGVVDAGLRDLRFASQTRGVSGSIAIADIDTPSLTAIGVWPWPRTIHAQILDELMRLGANEVVFDVDFSVPSNPTDDGAFARALADAGGYAYLAAFRQQQIGGAPSAFNLPLAQFSAFAQPVAVNVSLDGGGVVRAYPYALHIGGSDLLSAASLLAGRHSPADNQFYIDYSIDPDAIDRIPVAELLDGQLDTGRVRGKNIIVGASAVELRDFFVVPRHGIIPGSVLQALAYETLQQNRVLNLLPPWSTPLAIVLIGLVALAVRNWMRLGLAVPAALGLAIATEVAALLLQQHFAILFDTAGLHFALAAYLLNALVIELVRRGRLRRLAEDRLRYLSEHDPLTGALSRLRLVELIDAKLASGEDAAVIIVDLRRFQIINDTLGHSQGDGLLKQAVSRLSGMGPDAVARLGGDSFALLVPGLEPTKLAGFAQAVTRWLSFPYDLDGGHQAIIAAGAGATSSMVSGRDAEALLSHADMALSQAKQLPGNGVALFHPDMSDRLRSRQTLDAALRQGLMDRQFTLLFQPQVELATGEIVGAEALARWTHPKLGVVSPAQFIPAAEETGLIVELGTWALLSACQEAARWPRHLKIGVNVSPVQFELGDVVADVKSALAKSGLAPGRLEIEITEGLFVRNFDETARRLDEIRSLGVHVALDDFGTGYSSLSYLARLPVDKIKIDQSFVRRLPKDPQAAAIIQAIVTIAGALGKEIIAEGIEDADQAWMLELAGCNLAQGFYFGRPMQARDLMAMAANPPAKIGAVTPMQATGT